MYIYYQDTPGTSTNTIQWVQCNPIGSVTSQYSEDEPINPIPPGPEPPVPPTPVPPDPLVLVQILIHILVVTLMYFQNQQIEIAVVPEHLSDFLPGDKVEFQLGLPGQEQLIEDSLIDEVGTPDNSNGIFIRGYNDTALDLPDGTLMRNDSRAIYSVNTAAPHDLVPGDLVKIENSSLKKSMVFMM